MYLLSAYGIAIAISLIGLIALVISIKRKPVEERRLIVRSWCTVLLVPLLLVLLASNLLRRLDRKPVERVDSNAVAVRTLEDANKAINDLQWRIDRLETMRLELQDEISDTRDGMYLLTVLLVQLGIVASIFIAHDASKKLKKLRSLEPDIANELK